MSNYFIASHSVVIALMFTSFIVGSGLTLLFESIYTNYYRQCKNEYQKELARIEIQRLIEREEAREQ